MVAVVGSVVKPLDPARSTINCPFNFYMSNLILPLQSAHVRHYNYGAKTCPPALLSSPDSLSLQQFVQVCLYWGSLVLYQAAILVPGTHKVSRHQTKAKASLYLEQIMWQWTPYSHEVL